MDTKIRRIMMSVPIESNYLACNAMLELLEFETLAAREALLDISVEPLAAELG